MVTKKIHELQCCHTTLWNINVRKQAINDKLQGNVATCLTCVGVVSNQIKKRSLLSLPVKTFFKSVHNYKLKDSCLVHFVCLTNTLLKVEEVVSTHTGSLRQRAVKGLRVCVCVWSHTHTHIFNGPLPRTTHASQNRKGETNLDFTEATDSEWQWHQLHLAPGNHASTPPLSFYRLDALPAAQPTASKHWRHFCVCITYTHV